MVVLAAMAALPALYGRAQGVDAWLDSAEAHAFRDRVVQLALLYRESSGIDPRGYKVVARMTDRSREGCPVVDVETSQEGAVVRQESLPACRH